MWTVDDHAVEKIVKDAMETITKKFDQKIDAMGKKIEKVQDAVEKIVNNLDALMNALNDWGMKK